MSSKEPTQLEVDNMLISTFVANVTGEIIISADDFNKLGEASYTGENEGVKWHIPQYKWYHSSWNDLMQAIQAIEKAPDFPFFVHILGNACYIDTTNPDIQLKKGGWIVSSSDLFSYEEGFLPTKIEAVYKTVVEFIKWYNKEIQ